MGDHRGDSKDSRCQGPVPVDNIIGRAIALVWPTDRATELEIPASFDVLDGTTGTAGTDSEPAAVGTAGDGAPAAWNTAWHQPPSLPTTAMQILGSQTTSRAATPEPRARPRRLAP
jgi:hypothetical protein